MIRNTTARTLMYSWHDGMNSAFYAAASSGFVRDWSSLLMACDDITDFHDRAKLGEWLRHKQRKSKQIVYNNAGFYVLPWAHRSYVG